MTHAPGDDVDRGARWALAVCCCALFMTLLDLSITFVALPTIGASTGASPAELQWVVSGYVLAFGLVPVLGGRLGDDHGRKRMFLIGVAAFVATSAAAGLAPNAWTLIVVRVVQGLSGGLINPQVSGLVQQLFRGAARARAFGAIGTVVALGTALGPLVGGLLIGIGGDDLGWRLVFFVNVPIGIVILVLARRWIPADLPTGRHRLDVGGALLLGGAIFCVIFAAVEYDALRDPRLAVLAVPAAVLSLLFWRRESRLTRLDSDPLVDLRLFRRPSYTAGCVLALAFFCGMTGMPLVLALYYQDGLGYSALQSGLGITAYAVGSAVAAPLAGRVVTRVGRRLVVVACLTYAVGTVGLALVAATAPSTGAGLLLAAPLFVAGLGVGGVITPNQALSLADVDPVTGSTAGGVLQTSQRMGAAIGQAVVGAAFFALLPDDVDQLRGAARGEAFGSALSGGLVVSLGFVVMALAIGLVDLLVARRRLALASSATGSR